MAVYTEVASDDLEEFLAQYDIGQLLSYKGIAEGVENSNYLLQTTKGNFILTLYEKRVNPDDLPFFLNLMEHLAAKGIICPLPLHGKDGNPLRDLCSKKAVVVTFLSGMGTQRINNQHCGQLGEALARLHLAGLSFEGRAPSNELSVEGWEKLFQATQNRADEVSPGLAQELEGEINFLKANWPENLPQGIIHADLFPDNVFFLGEKLSGLIDFYFACRDFLAYDVAVCLNAWCFDSDFLSFNLTKGKALLLAYDKIRPFSSQEKEMLPILARGAAIRFLLTRLYDLVNTPPGALVKRKDPMEYLRKQRFHRHITTASGYGLD